MIRIISLLDITSISDAFTACFPSSFSSTKALMFFLENLFLFFSKIANLRSSLSSSDNQYKYNNINRNSFSFDANYTSKSSNALMH